MTDILRVISHEWPLMVILLLMCALGYRWGWVDGRRKLIDELNK